ncbi:MAG TPA: zeaxanthin glucosyltransferase [Pseudomonas sp.]|jgi:zeaxanthin glucosyltransferase|uniref:glycosyltransferase n=1 Tax=Stutzerimonas xanthomarina TaxID=271420 RepID=UPI000E9F766D|nr:glycosyltransferase [Stutzerimonas xanthomarina]MBU0811950.1 glycosyltransferase [Gammaproteobacteria bacterium]HAQ87405.1 zeaxanthin glucosyltransferase [Pseudomonas sp.]MBK3849170.1 glycosyltransferase [Stutzerimonas xanthomarina]MBU1771798.1 glycosyltransferase [Gammaproteobacteria bacterium]HAW24042.1 zeaxanthin glucosyltransferase [Pseudomonas sp.]|tara:strand:- start:292 stop:1581 length:1290 start_codon:yes stop_codon:yes gene_type:complete
MTHFAVIGPAFHSHVRAMESVACELLARGHRVTVVQQADVAAMLRDPRLGFAQVGAGSHPPGSLQAVIDRAARPGGPWGIRRVIADMASATDMVCREAPAVLRAIGADCIIADQMEPAGGLVAEHLGLPFVSVACALPVNREALVPLPVMPWRYRATPWGEQLNLHSSGVYDRAMQAHAAVIARHAAAFGLPPRQRLDECLSPLLQLSQTTPGFDFPRTSLPEHFHGIGPLRSALSDEPPLDIPVATGRPFVFASLGTLQGDRFGLFGRIAAACRELDLQLLIAHCGRLDASQERRLLKAGASWVTDFAPQRAMLARADAVITHAGLNTVLDALEAGVPSLALPIAFDQPGVAARVVHAGVGLKLDPRLASRRRIVQGLRRLLGEPGFAERARKLGDEVRTAGGAPRAAQLIEAALDAEVPALQRVEHG